MKKILFTIIIVVLFFVFLEGAVRLYLFAKHKDPQYLKITVKINYSKPRYRTPEELKVKGRLEYFNKGMEKEYYKFASGSYGLFAEKKFPFTINSLGFRGEEFDREKKKGVTRVCVFGGSAVWGHGVEDSDTFPFYLSESLGGNFEVINCGILGYRMKEIYNLLNEEVINYSPDIIVIYSTYNDAFKPDLVKEDNILYKLHERLYYNSMLYTILLEKYSALKYKTATPFLYLKKDIPPDYSRYLDAVIRLAKSKDVKVVLVKEMLNLSHENIKREDKPELLAAKYHRISDEKSRCIIRHYYCSHKMEELANENDILLIDETRAMEGKDGFFLDIVHLSPQGTQKLAGVLAEQILSKQK